MKLLVVEDETDLLTAVTSYLSSEGFLVESANDFPQALDLIQVYSYDCIIVDINLPRGSGLELVKEIRSHQKSAGVIIISARDSVEDKVNGLLLGSDDYLTKPFHLSELNARIKALIRRRTFEGNDLFSLNEQIRISIGEKAVYVSGKEVEFTAKEFELLMYFVSSKGKVLTKEAIAEHLWGSSYDQADSFDFIYTHIRNVRKKLTDAGADDPIKTVYALGYKLVTI